MKKLLALSVSMLILVVVAARAQDFVYQPINPAFGGNPYNYSWLLAQAQAQNNFEEDILFGYEEEDPLLGLQDDLNRQILNQITQEFYRNQFGEDGLSEGYYKFGTYEIDISPVSEGMQIRIIDIYTGSETTIIIPYF